MNFKKTTYTLLDELSKLKIKTPKINYHFNNLYNDILSIYKSINLEESSITYTSKKIESQNNKYLIDIIHYLYKNSKLDKCMNNYTKDEQNHFIDLLNENNYTKLNNWLNQYGSKFMRKLHLLLITNKIPQELTNKDIDTDTINEFVNMEILDYLLNNLDCKHNYNVTYENISLNLTIYGCKNIPKAKIQFIITIVLMMALYKTKHAQTLTIDLFLTPFKKKINLDTKLLGAREINSGFTSPGYKICIFRNEELYKVLIHELIHYLDLDLGFMTFDTMHQYVNINPKTEIRANEAYTELLAIIIMSIIHSYDGRKNIALYKKILTNELKFSLYNVAKILVYFGFNTADEFFKPYYSDHFKQNTSVCSYFIIKTALLFNLNNTNITKEYMVQCFTSDYKNTINDIMTKIQKNKQSKLLFNTLKMSLYELN